MKLWYFQVCKDSKASLSSSSILRPMTSFLRRYRSSHMWPCAQKSLILSLTLYCCHLDVLNNFWTGNPIFSFCTGPHKWRHPPALATLWVSAISFHVPEMWSSSLCVNSCSKEELHSFRGRQADQTFVFMLCRDLPLCNCIHWFQFSTSLVTWFFQLQNILQILRQGAFSATLEEL